MYFASNDSNDVVASPAKIIIYDLNAGQVLQTFVFPPQVAPFNNSVRLFLVACCVLVLQLRGMLASGCV
jgi:hypothetical protein